MQTGFPLRLEREVQAESPELVYRAVAELLRQDGFRIQETEPPEAEPAMGFRGGFRAVRDTVLGAEKRRRGYFLLGLGAALTVLMLFVYITEFTTNRFFASAPLLPIVLLGGWGLSMLREPAKRLRRVVETRFEQSSVPGSLRLVVQGGIGEAAGDYAVSEWASEPQDAAVDEQRLDALLDRLTVA